MGRVGEGRARQGFAVSDWWAGGVPATGSLWADEQLLARGSRDKQGDGMEGRIDGHQLRRLERATYRDGFRPVEVSGDVAEGSAP